MMVQSKTRKLSVTAMLAAVATVLMFLDFSIPIVPSFIKLDVSELPALLAAYSLGPVSGMAVCLIKNLFNLLFHGSTGGVGELCNFLLGASFVIPAGLLYQYKKNRKMAFVGALIGAAVMAYACAYSPAVRRHGWMLPCVIVLAVMITLSTLFIKQHSALDVITALIVCVPLWFAVYGRRGIPALRDAKRAK